MSKKYDFFANTNTTPPRAGLKGRRARGNFHWRAPMTYYMMLSFV